MRIERTAFAALALIAVLSSITLAVAVQRFGNATTTFDAVEFDLIDFTYTRNSPEVVFTMEVSNGGVNDLLISGLEYSYVVNGVLAGGGDDLRSRTVILPGGRANLVLPGRITDVRYVDGQPADEPLDWLVRGRILITVDDRMDDTWVGFAYRTETE